MCQNLPVSLSELYACAEVTFSGAILSIDCKLGLWGVVGENHAKVLKEAMHYFQQYKDDGEYDELLEDENNSK